MALTTEEKTKLDKLSFINGGSHSEFMSDCSKMDGPDGTFLFIGLGGKGCQVVADLKTEISRKIQCSQNGKRWNHVEYLAIDSDDYDLSRLCGGNFGEAGSNGVLQNQEVFHLYDSMSAAVLNNPQMRPDSIKEWMNESLTIQLIGNGSGGIRQAGRGLLFGERTISTLCERISSKLARLSTVSGKETQVYIFAGIGGGTGSGTVIDIPYIIREIAHRQLYRIKLLGYMFLPDTYEIERNMAPHIESNSYAALQEIDVFMELRKNNARRFKARYSSRFSVDSTENIFDACVLVSGKRETGLVPNPDRFSREKVVSHVIIQMFSVNESVPEAFTKISGTEDHFHQNADCHFLGIGCGTVEAPVNQMMAYVAKHVLDKITEGWNHHAVPRDVDIILKEYKMEPAAVGDQIIQNSGGPFLKWPMGGVGGIGGIKKIAASWMKYRTDVYTQWDTASRKNMSRIADNIARDFEKKITEKGYGIYFLREVLTGRRAEGDLINGILEQVKSDYKTQLQNLISGTRAGQRQAIEDMDHIENRHYPIFPFDEYGEAYVKSLVWEATEYLYDHYVRECLDEAIVNLEEKVEEVQKYIEIFEYLKNLVDRNYWMLMNGRMSGGEGQILNFAQNTPETQNVITYLNRLLDEKTSDELAQKFGTKMWGNKTCFDPVHAFTDFLKQEFEPILKLSLQDFLEIKYSPTMMEKAAQQLCISLSYEMPVLLALTPQVRLQDFSSETVFVVPDDALLGNKIKEYMSLRSNTRVIPVRGCQGFTGVRQMVFLRLLYWIFNVMKKNIRSIIKISCRESIYVKRWKKIGKTFLYWGVKVIF